MVYEHRTTITAKRLKLWNRIWVPPVTCRMCSGTLKVGDRVVRKHGKRRVYTPAVYHESCYDEGSVRRNEE